MEIVCGQDIIDVAEITYALTHKVSEYELGKIEKKCNGPLPATESQDSFTCLTSYEVDVLNKHWAHVSWALKHVGPKGDGQSKWAQACDLNKQSEFSKSYYSPIVWQYKVNGGTNAAGWPITITHEEKLNDFDHLLPALQLLISYQPPKKTKGQKVGKVVEFVLTIALLRPDFYSDDFNVPDEVKADLQPICSKLETIKAEQDAAGKRLAARDQFMEQYREKSALTIGLTEDRERIYLEGHCGFDIFEKEEELSEKRRELLVQKEKQELHEHKLRNSENAGEKVVEYALKWILASNKDLFVQIANDCESKHRYNCILLRNPEFIDEPQEFDHILVCAAGVIVIETKHWKDRVEIRDDGKWVRKSNEAEYGVESPKMQMQRHEALLKSILHDVPIYSLLCFSNASIIIDGRTNFKSYPIVTVEELDEAIRCICSAEACSADEINKIVTIIEAHKTGKTK